MMMTKRKFATFFRACAQPTIRIADFTGDHVLNIKWGEKKKILIKRLKNCSIRMCEVNTTVGAN